MSLMRSALNRQRGFTYMGLLFAVAVMGLMLTLVGRVWSTTEQREREIQLLFVGHAYRNAIASYFASGHRFPAELKDLVQDDRSPEPRHHLRTLYADPTTGQADWNLVMTPDGQGIMGVVSSSNAAPIKRDRFDPADESFKDSDCYCSWRFIYYPNRFMRSLAPSTLTVRPSGGAPAGPSNTFHPGRLSPLIPDSSNPASPLGSDRSLPDSATPAPFGQGSTPN
ncbi:MAG: type II secretion system protein [Gammaproteobacteria bacterium]|nr:type II secretion system protein [Gammaproteobacteria bacterium]